DQTTSLLQMVGGYTNKPNFMTEYSDAFAWLTTAQFIHNTVTQANASSYIYWKLAWATPSSGTDAAMVSISSNGDFTVTAFFYVIKHTQSILMPATKGLMLHPAMPACW